MIISGDRQISYGDIHARIARAANGFRGLGMRDGKPVGAATISAKAARASR